jgi:transposase
VSWKTKTRWSREFKLLALARMEEVRDVTALALELGVRRELLYKWRRLFLAGGPEALHPIGRPLNETRMALPPSLAPPPDTARQVETLERKIGQQQLDLDFFREALRHVGEARRRSGVPGGKASTR